MRFLSLIIVFSPLLFSCNSPAQNGKDKKQETFNITKTDAEWKTQLSSLTYKVLRHEETERSFSSELNDNHEAGTYTCAACGTAVFESNHKFDSGTGWPSFDREVKGNVAFAKDRKLGYSRTEEHCASCGGHLGHVFNDGPRETTGERHCINGAALKFIPKNGKSE